MVELPHNTRVPIHRSISPRCHLSWSNFTSVVHAKLRVTASALLGPRGSTSATPECTWWVLPDRDRNTWRRGQSGSWEVSVILRECSQGSMRSN